MQWGILVFRYCFLEKKHHLSNWNATDCVSPEQSISPCLQQLLSLEHRPASAEQIDWKHKTNKPGTIQQSRKEIKIGNYVVSSYFLPKDYLLPSFSSIPLRTKPYPYAGPIHTVIAFTSKRIWVKKILSSDFWPVLGSCPHKSCEECLGKLEGLWWFDRK